MSTNGHLKFQGTNRATFVGATSNIMFDTTTTSLGIGVTGTDHPSSNLYITGNAYVSSNIAVGGVLTMGTVNVVARHDLEAVTALGNTTPLTVEFQNADTSFVTTGNVQVGKELTVTGNTTVSSNLTVSGNATVSSNLTVSGNVTVSKDLTVTEDLTAPFVTGLGHLATKTYTFDPTNNTSKYFLGWTQEEGMEIEIQDTGYNHGGLNRFYITFHWGGEPILSSADISELKKYNFYYTYKFDRLYLWFNETLATHTDFPNVTYTIRMKTLKNVINLTEPGSSDQYIGTTIGVSAASALTRMSVTNINSNVGIGTVSPGRKLEVYTGNGAVPGLRLRRYPTGATYTDFQHADSTSPANSKEGLAITVGDGNVTAQEVMRVCGNGFVGINTTNPHRTLDVQAPARPSTYPFAIGGSWDNRAHYVAKTHFPGVNKSSYSIDFLIGGSERPGWLRACAGGSQSGSGTLGAQAIAEFIISPYGTNFYAGRRFGDTAISVGSSGTHNGGRITVSHGLTSYPRLWFEIYHEYGVYW